jgi:uncharacterized protein YjiK
MRSEGAPGYLRAMPRPRLVTDRRIPIDLEETSDVAALAGGAFLVVSDVETRAAIVAHDRRTTFLELPGLERGDSSLEAVAWDATTGLLVSYAEDHGELLVHRWNGAAGATATLVEKREVRFGKRKNKGVEGIAWMNGRILCANEGKPRALFLLGSADDDAIEVAMDPAIDDVCEDLSGLAHDPGRGSWLLVSDESATLVELAIDEGARPSTRLLGAWDLHDERGRALERVEGVAVDAEGAWWVLLEDEHELCRVRAPSPR